MGYWVDGLGHPQTPASVSLYHTPFCAREQPHSGCSVCETGINLPAPFDSFPGPPGPPSTLPLSTQTSSGSSTLSKKRPPPPPPGHKRTLSDPPSPLPHGPPNKGTVPWGKSSSSQGPGCSGGGGHLARSADGGARTHADPGLRHV